MNIKVIGQAVVLTSLAVKMYDKAHKFAPELLKLTDNGKDETFSVMLKHGTSSINKYGVSFGEVSAQGKAQCTFLLPDYVSPDKREEYIADTYGLTLVKLQRVEARICVGLEDVMKDIDTALTDMIVE
jgi:hypothetical protein